MVVADLVQPLKEPKLLPKGTRIEVDFWYDSTPEREGDGPPLARRFAAAPGCGPEGPRTQRYAVPRRANLYCKPSARGDVVTVAEQSHAVTAIVRWVRGPSGPLPPKAARNTRRGKPSARGDVVTVAEQSHAVTATVRWVRGPSGPLPPKAARNTRWGKPSARGDVVTVAEQSHAVTATVRWVRVAFWPAAAEGGQEHALGQAQRPR